MLLHPLYCGLGPTSTTGPTSTYKSPDALNTGRPDTIRGWANRRLLRRCGGRTRRYHERQVRCSSHHSNARHCDVKGPVIAGTDNQDRQHTCGPP